MKKLLSILFSFMLALTCLPTSTHAAIAAASATAFTSTTAAKTSTVDTFSAALEKQPVMASGVATGTSSTVARITAPDNGTLVVLCNITAGSKQLTATITGGSTPSSYYNSGTRLLVVPKVKKNSVYSLVATTSANDYVQAVFQAICIPNASNRTIGKSIMMAASTGDTMYQQFKVSKRGVATIQLSRVYINSIFGFNSSTDLSVTYDLQKLNGKKWTTIRSSAFASKSTDFANFFGLNAGTYRIKYKISNTSILVATASSKAVTSSSYGSSKKSAKAIARTKSKTQTFIAGESSGKAHWYKIKVSKKQATTITLTPLGGDGNIYCTVYGPSGSGLKKVNSTTGIKFSGTAKAGTYYIKVYKSNAKYSGGYKITYTK